MRLFERGLQELHSINVSPIHVLERLDENV